MAEMQAKTDAVREFHAGGGDMAAFVNDHMSGSSPWGTIVDHAGRMVVADADRTVFYTLYADGPGFSVLRFTDALAAMDPEVEPEPGVESSVDGTYVVQAAADVGEAFRALCADADLDLPAAPAP